ncbi:hypothetical protein Tco_1297425 [Tanacetum coccineum]
MLRACPHHGFTELTQIDTLYNGLNENEQDSLNIAAGGNLLSKTTIEESSSKTDERINKLADLISTLVEIVTKKVVTPATVKAVEESCVICGDAHAYYNCTHTDSNQSNVCATTGSFFQNQASTSGTLPSNTIPNPKGEMKAITTRSGATLAGPSVPPPSPSKEVDREPKTKTDQVLTESTNNVPPPVVQPSLVLLSFLLLLFPLLRFPSLIRINPRFHIHQG